MKKSFLHIPDRALPPVLTVARLQGKDEIAAQKQFFLIRKDSGGKFDNQMFCM